MSTCGMYDYAGEWGYRIGLPAKSGVAGGVVAVLPGQFGIGVFSPRLDPKGNSVRGVEVCKRLATDFALHPLRYQPRVAAAVRRTTRGHETRSNRVRPVAAHDYLSEHASCIVVYELEGDLYFGSMERVFRRIAADLESVRFVVLDCKRVTSVDAAARSMLLALESELASTGRSLAISYVRRESLVYEQLEELHARGVHAYPDTDEALEVFEETLLAEADEAATIPAPELAAQEMLAGMSPEELAAIERVAELQPVSDGDVVFQAGDAADAMYFVLAGSVSVPRAPRIGSQPPLVDAGCRRGVRRDGDPRQPAPVGRHRRRRARCAGPPRGGRSRCACHRAPEPCGDAVPQPLGRALAPASQCERSGSGARPVAGCRQNQAATRATRSMTS